MSIRDHVYPPGNCLCAEGRGSSGARLLRLGLPLLLLLPVANGPGVFAQEVESAPGAGSESTARVETHLEAEEAGQLTPPPTAQQAAQQEGGKAKRKGSKGLPAPVLDPEEHYAKAMEALEVGDRDSAYDHFERAVVGAPERLHWGAEYRQAIIAGEAYDRGIELWEALAEAHPEVANVQLNLGYAYVDKIPVEGAITAVILANKALGRFGQALELEETWLAYYTRGNSYMYWPAIFGRTQMGIDDLQKAVALAAEAEPRPYHGQAWAALGDGYWRLEQREKMTATWKEGLERYPGTPELEARVALSGPELDAYLEKHFETSTRVGTDLRALLSSGDGQ